MWVQTRAGQLVNLDHAEEIVTRLTEANQSVELVAVLPDDSAWELAGFHVNTLKVAAGMNPADALYESVAPYRDAIVRALAEGTGLCNLVSLDEQLGLGKTSEGD